jgi:hypothetical protein
LPDYLLALYDRCLRVDEYISTLLSIINGSFTLATGLKNGVSYDVTVQSQPVNQICSIVNGSGIINGANVTNVTVTSAVG